MKRILFLIIFMYTFSSPSSAKQAVNWSGLQCVQKTEAIFKKFQKQARQREQDAQLLQNDETAFYRKNGVFKDVTTTDNIAFRESNELADSTKPELYVDIEMAVSKELNDDVIKNKDTVTAFSNYYKKIVMGNIFGNKEIYPELNKQLSHKYSNFKSLRLALQKDNPKLQKELDHLCQRAGHQMAEMILASGRLNNSGARGLAARPQSWFLCGAGPTVDMAGAAVRTARVGADAGNPTLRNFDEVESNLDALVQSVQSTQKQLFSRLGRRYPKLFQDVPGQQGKKILSRDATEVLLKTKVKGHDETAYLEAVNQRLQEKLNIPHLDDENLKLLKKYKNDVDQFSPGIVSDERVVIDLSQAPAEIVSVDFAKQNVKNLEQTMLALSSDTATSSREVIDLARKGEKIATVELEKRKSKVNSIFKKILGDKGAARFSGDDGISMPPAITEAHKRDLINQLSEVDPTGFRMTFIPRGVSRSMRSELIVEAENIEKELRRQLEAQISPNELNSLMLGIDMKGTQVGEGPVTIIFGGSPKEDVKNVVLKTLDKILKETR